MAVVIIVEQTRACFNLTPEKLIIEYRQNYMPVLTKPSDMVQTKLKATFERNAPCSWNKKQLERLQSVENAKTLMLGADTSYMLSSILAPRSRVLSTWHKYIQVAETVLYPNDNDYQKGFVNMISTAELYLLVLVEI